MRDECTHTHTKHHTKNCQIEQVHFVELAQHEKKTKKEHRWKKRNTKTRRWMDKCNEINMKCGDNSSQCCFFFFDLCVMSAMEVVQNSVYEMWAKRFSFEVCRVGTHTYLTHKKPLHTISALLFGTLWLPKAEYKWSYVKTVLRSPLFFSLTRITTHNAEYVHKHHTGHTQRVISRIGILHCAPVVYRVRCGYFVQFICECRLDNHATKWSCLCVLCVVFIFRFYLLRSLDD